MINKVRAADEQKMLRDLQRLSRQGHDLEFRGQRGETPVIVIIIAILDQVKVKSTGSCILWSLKHVKKVSAS